MPQNIALRGGLVIDGTGRRPHYGTVTIENDIIRSIGAGPDDVAHINLAGCTLLPGFVHAHAHTGFKHLSGEDLQDYDTGWLEACLDAGITTERDMGALNRTPLEKVLQRRDELNATGRFPRIVSPGKFIAAPGGYGGQDPLAVASAGEADAVVGRAALAGADFVKTSLEYGFGPGTALPRLTEEQLRAICAAARARGLRAAAHISQCEPLRLLVEAGITDAGHVPYEPMDDALIASMVRRGVVMTPTLTLYAMLGEKFGAPLLPQALDNVRRFHGAGGAVAVGDDYIEPEPPWYRPGLPIREIELLGQAGLDAMAIIVALTANGALACGLAGETGTLEVGKRADVAVVRGNPLDDIACLKEIEMVVSAGRIVRGRCRD